MSDPTLHIYYKKKNLLRSFAFYLFSLFLWLGIYFFICFQQLLNPHPNVSETTHFIAGAILTLVFGAWALKFIIVLAGCISEYRKAPSLAYSLSSHGILSRRNGWFISWQEISHAATKVKNEGIYLHKNRKAGYSINSWGIDSNEMEHAKNYVLQKLPISKTKRLR